MCINPNTADEVGKLLAQQLSMYYLNTTELFKFDHIPHTIEEFIETRKEKGYRELEEGTISYASSFYNTIMAVDSGVVKSEKNIEKLQKGGYIIHIRLDVKKTKKALDSALYDNETIRKFYAVSENSLAVRQAKMKECADIEISGNCKSNLKICADVIRAIRKKWSN